MLPQIEKGAVVFYCQDCGDKCPDGWFTEFCLCRACADGKPAQPAREIDPIRGGLIT